MLPFIIFIVICFTFTSVIFFVAVGIYNGLIYKKNQVEKSFSSVDILLKKRCDLIPNLVAVVKKHMQFEQQTLAEITRLRSRVMSEEVNESQFFSSENQISKVFEIFFGKNFRNKNSTRFCAFSAKPR